MTSSAKPPAGTNRLGWLIGGVLGCFLLLFLGLKDHPSLGPAGVVSLLQEHRAALLPIGWGLMVADLILPVPATVVVAMFGIQWGILGGALAGTAGSVLAGVVAYGLCRAMGDRAAAALAGPEGLRKLDGFFTRWGVVAVAISRSMPLIPEAISCLAGLSRMNFGRYLLGCVVGAAPMGVCFAWIGHWGQATDEPLWSLIVSAGLPVVLVIPISFLLRKQNRRVPDADSERDSPSE